MIFCETERLRMRALREQDCAVIVEYFAEREVVLPLVHVPHPYAYSDALGFLRQMEKTYDAGRPEFYAIADKSTDDLLGGIGIHPEHTFNKRPFVGEMGYWLGKSHWGQGYMREALPAVMGHAFATIGLRRIVANTSTDNERSKRVLRDMGFSYLGDFDRPQPIEGRTPQASRWDLPREDFERRHKAL